MTTLEAQATAEMLGANPFLGLSARQLIAAGTRLLAASARHAPAAAGLGRRLATQLLAAARGQAPVGVDADDRRFADDSWSTNPVYRRAMNAYLVWRAALYDLVDVADLDAKSAMRARLAVSLVAETVAPTNTLLGNPAAMRRAIETNGVSLADGLRNVVHDIRFNGAMPSMVDRDPFVLGETVARTRGSVVLRTGVLELIQYEPPTVTVHRTPLLMIPSQVNKFWILDVAPGRSLVEYLLAHGHRLFMVSWRNPGPEQRDWRLDTYVEALRSALDAVADVSGSPEVNVVGACAGGITTSALLGHLAAVGDRRVRSVTFLVTMLDTSVDSAATAFVSKPAVAAALRRSQRRGVLDGRTMARVFGWLRPNELVWSFWVNNYLLGRKPPPSAVLAWNTDTTNLPAGLHADLLALAVDNGLARPDGVEVLGTPVDLAKVDCDAYVVAGVTDHITPWPGCYRTVHLLGGPSRFVLSSAGHIQAIVNPPGNPKARYFTNDDHPMAAQEWQARATAHSGSWWDDWRDWLADRSGDRVPAPPTLGSSRYPAISAAPGCYVRE